MEFAETGPPTRMYTAGTSEGAGLGADDDAKGKPRADEARLPLVVLSSYFPPLAPILCPSSQFPLLINRASDSPTPQANLVVMAVRSLFVFSHFFFPLSSLLLLFWCPFGALSWSPRGIGRVELG